MDGGLSEKGGPRSDSGELMELVGRVTTQEEESLDRIYLSFRCCNGEVFRLRLPPALKRIPLDTLARVWVHYSMDVVDGRPEAQIIINHWEDIS
jgi:hypothetical protein